MGVEPRATKPSMRRLSWVMASCIGLAASCGHGPPGFGADGGSDAPFFGDSSNVGTKGCSSDLHTVVDSNGTVIETCPSDQGCEAGACVPACQAAGASQGSIGCDYVVATPAFFQDVAPPCFAMFLANNWPSAAQITVELAGQSYDVTTFGRIANAGTPETSWASVPSTGVPAGQVAVLFLSQDPSSVNTTPLTCPVPPAISQPGGTAVSGVATPASGVGAAWHVTASMPVTAYDILPYGGAKSYLPSAELLYPTTSWGTNYFGIVSPVGDEGGTQWGQIVAVQDNTTITILPTVALPAGMGVAAAPANVPTTYTLNAGEIVQWWPAGEMSGTIIQSDKPSSFFGGNGFFFDSGCCGDSTHQQTMPITAYGSEYAVAPYTTRKPDLSAESIPYRFVGAVTGTTLTFDPPVTGAPPTIDKGQVVDFTTTLAFVVTSQDAAHPFYVGQVMTGAGAVTPSRAGCEVPLPMGVDDCQLGDQEFVNVLPPAQFLSKYVFFTDTSYATTNLVITRVNPGAGFQDVSLDCAGTLTGWQPVGTSGKYEFTNIDLVRANIQNGTCNNGPHTATSTGPFGVTVWGIDLAASYAYPAGGNAAGINKVVVPPLPN